MKLLDFDAYNAALPNFNVLLVNHINVHINNNYVREFHDGKYIFSNVTTDEGDLTFTISYDRFYQVPVLHFVKNGQLKQSGNSVVDIHPIMQTPYQMVHPCETQSIMGEIACPSSIQYLVCWFGIHIEQTNTGVQLRVPTMEGDDKHQHQ